MLRLPKVGVLFAIVALMLFAVPAWADQFPVTGHAAFDLSSFPPTVGFTYTGTDGDGTGVSGSGQFDLDISTGEISNGTATFTWDTGFSLDIEFSGTVSFMDGSIMGIWDQIGGGLSGTFMGQVDADLMGANVEFDSP
jgi:hypothetical protein